MKRIILLFLAVIFLTSCASPATPAVTITATTASTPTQTPTAAPTNTPTITPTKVPEVISPNNASRLVRYAVLGHGYGSAVVSPDHKTIAVASAIGVIFYDAETLEKIKTIETSASPVYFSFSPDGTKLAIELVIVKGTLDEKAFRHDTFTYALEVWDVQTSTRLSRYDDVGWLDALIFSPDGCQVITWGKIVFNICENNATQKSAKDWRNPSAVFSPDGTQALIFVVQEGWTLWDIQQNKKLRDVSIKASLDFQGQNIVAGCQYIALTEKPLPVIKKIKYI